MEPVGITSLLSPQSRIKSFGTSTATMEPNGMAPILKPRPSVMRTYNASTSMTTMQMEEAGGHVVQWILLALAQL